LKAHLAGGQITDKQFHELRTKIIQKVGKACLSTAAQIAFP
jgi:hypothetical protein